MTDQEEAKRAARARERARATAATARKRARRLSRNETTAFIDFIRNRGVVGMAIGLAIGTVASGTISTIVVGFVTPVVQFIVGTNTRLERQEWHMELWGRTADFQWGAALSSLITLVATIFVIYLIVRIAHLDRLDKQEPDPIKIPPPKPQA